MDRTTTKQIFYATHTRPTSFCAKLSKLCVYQEYCRNQVAVSVQRFSRTSTIIQRVPSTSMSCAVERRPESRTRLTLIDDGDRSLGTLHGVTVNVNDERTVNTKDQTRHSVLLSLFVVRVSSAMWQTTSLNGDYCSTFLATRGVAVRLLGTKVCRYNWHSAGCLGWP